MSNQLRFILYGNGLAAVTSRPPPSAPRRWSRWLSGLFALAGIAGCASPGPYNPSQLPLPQLGQVQDLCRAGMGLSVGTSSYVDCVENLSESAAALSKARVEGQALADARRACLSKGLAPGQPELSECELSSASVHVAPASELTKVSIDTTALQPLKSYYYASSTEIHRREQVVCARLGYDPVSDLSFRTCVASLDQALYESEHSMQ